ncbi:MAG: ribonuclease HII [Verrucomicrobiota bacterium]
MEILWQHDLSWKRTGGGLIGVDEAGRGCLAGPVFAAAVYLPESLFSMPWTALAAPHVDDSKKLSEKERGVARDYLSNQGASLGILSSVGVSTVAEIEEHNILGATTLAMSKALKALSVPLQAEEQSLFERTAHTYPSILVDGRPLKKFPFSHEALVKGDSRSLAIALASVVAKVGRDRWMSQASKSYPQYGWERNKGYGTAVHRRALLEHGPSPQHRRLFLRKILQEQ